MEKMSPLSLLSVLISLAAIVPVFLSFTIDDVHTKTFTGKTSNTEYFGYKALQFKNESAKWIVVSAPMKRNGTGGLYQCSPQRGDCQPFYFAEEDSAKSTGMALASKSTGPTQITACSHSLAHECDSNSYLNGLCYQFNDQLMLKNNITAAYQECTKGKVDLVFLFDGSESLKAEDFQKNKQFIIDIMKSFSNTSIQFAAVQFSKFFSTVFTFKDYHTNEAWDLLSKEVHMKSLTNTYGAINYVLEKILYNATAGAIPDATKVLVIITDGTPTELDYYKSVPALDERTIIRYVIGVGKVDLQTLSHLASEPKANSTFKIYDYNGLTNILDGLQKKIFNIEGTQNKLGKTFKNEMSQSGFSAVYLKDTLILGTVGSNNWRGSLIEVGPESVYHEITDPQMEEDSYMGYSVEVGRKSNKDLYFSGAPRYQHTGQVLVFHQTNGNWTVAETKKGEQIGEYFGAVLCAVDIDSDGETDFLLVGAPLYHGSQSEGRMFVYNLTAQLGMWEKERVSVSPLGRFASSISSLKDLNGDRLKDVAVGAPLENDLQGAVYIYLGDKLKGIQPKPCQRITAQSGGSSPLQFFGQSIDGRMDLGEDGLTDIIVGAREQVLLLRSKPVLNVSGKLSFNESEISTEQFQCMDTEKTLPVGTLKVCFVVENALNNTAGSVNLGLNVSYQLNLDNVRQKSRAFFQSNRDMRKIVSTMELSLGETCLNHTIYMMNCVKDTLSSLTVKLNFSQSENSQQNHSAVLNANSKTEVQMEVPFEKNCENKEKCVSHLELDFNTTTKDLLVVDQDYFNVTVKLSNQGDDSYDTKITFHYPSGLSFSKMKVLEATRRTLTSCSGPEDQNNKTTCSVSIPVYRSKTTAIFSCSFLISTQYQWSDSMEMAIIAHSDNGKSTTKNHSLPVKFDVDLAVKGNYGDSDTYFNFSIEDTEPKTMSHIFEVKNLGFTSLNVTATFALPTKYKHVGLRNYSISKNQSCGNFTKNKTEVCKEDHCWSIKCDFLLNSQSVVSFNLSAEAYLNETLPQRLGFSSHTFEEQLLSFVELSYDTNRYVQTASKDQTDPKKFHKAKIDCQVEFIILPNTHLIYALGSVAGLLLLFIIGCILYKIGFFKRSHICPDDVPIPGNNESGEANSKLTGGDDDEKNEISAQESSVGPKADGSDI